MRIAKAKVEIIGKLVLTQVIECNAAGIGGLVIVVREHCRGKVIAHHTSNIEVVAVVIVGILTVARDGNFP